MSLSAILAILRKDIVHGPKNFFFIQAVITPISTTLLVMLLFGSIFSGKPSIGFVYRGETRFRDRALIFAGLSDVFIELAGREIPVEVKTVTLGDGESTPWAQRFIPLLVLLAVIMNGFMIPASSLIDEKQRQTLAALCVSPISYREIVAAKCLFGFVVALVMGLIILLMNRSLGSNPGLLLLTLGMSAALSATCGGILGMLMAKADAFMNVMKSIMLLLYAPGILALFPQVPAWVGKLFPTYYVYSPVLEVSQKGAGLADIGFELIVLALLTAATLAVASAVGKRQQLKVA